MGFKQIGAETRGTIVYLYKKEKSQRFIAEETGASRKDVQRELKTVEGIRRA